MATLNTSVSLKSTEKVAGEFTLDFSQLTDNTFTDGLRQRPLGKKKIEAWLNMDISEFKDEVKRNYQRNEKLIDLSKIPDELENEILTQFRGAPHGDRSKLLNYFIKSRLKNLTETIGEF